MKFCLKCKNTGRILEKRLSDYVNSFDYYPVPCLDCQADQTKKSGRGSSPSSFSLVR